MREGERRTRANSPSQKLAAPLGSRSRAMPERHGVEGARTCLVTSGGGGGHKSAAILGR